MCVNLRTTEKTFYVRRAGDENIISLTLDLRFSLGRSKTSPQLKEENL